MDQKGFSPVFTIISILVILGLIAGGFYLMEIKKPSQIANSPSTITTNSGTDKTASSSDVLNDGFIMSDVRSTAAALEQCWADSNRRYDKERCGSTDSLEKIKYLNRRLPDKEIRIEISTDSAEAIVYSIEISQNAECENISTGDIRFYIYRTSIGKSKVECLSSPPALSNP